MKIAIMQPYLFPYIGYFQLINLVDKFVIYDDVNYIKRGWINRNQILLNGKPHMITIPLSSASQNRLINEITIHGGIKQKKAIIKTIRHAYANSPYFTQVFSLIEEVILNTEDDLTKYIEFSLKKLAEYLSLSTKFIISSNLDKDNALRGQDKILNICKNMGANTYINPIGGRDLYSKNKFKESGIELYFIKTNNIKYDQGLQNFIPNLSIIDILMFNNKKNIQLFLEDYKLV